MTAKNLITWNRYASLPAVVAEREVTAPILANALASKRNREHGAVAQLSPDAYVDLSRAMLRGYVSFVASGVES